MKLLGLDDPAGADRKRLVTFVEIDRCATDAIPVVTGCRLGKRALKFRDFGKVAATFCDLQEDRAVRVVARESSKQRAREMHPEIADKNAQQMHAYREMPDDECSTSQWVRVQPRPGGVPRLQGRARGLRRVRRRHQFQARSGARRPDALQAPAPASAITKLCRDRSAITSPTAAARRRNRRSADAIGRALDRRHRAHSDPREGLCAREDWRRWCAGRWRCRIRTARAFW